MAEVGSPLAPMQAPVREDVIVSALQTASVPNCGVSGKVKMQHGPTGEVTLSLVSNNQSEGGGDSDSESQDIPIYIGEKLVGVAQAAKTGLIYRRGGIVGRGSFGSVFRALDTKSGAMYAVKRVRFRGSSVERQAEEVSREIGIMRALRHRNIVELLDCHVTGKASLELVMPFVAGGSVYSLVQQLGALPEPVIRRYTAQIVAGLVYLHDNGVLHRDVKAANCLVAGDGTVLLADFGCAKSLETMCRVSDGVWTVCGTPTHMAPEVIKQKGVGRRADVWSLGCTVVEMATAKAPFSHLPNAAAVMYLVATNRAVPEIPTSLSSAGQDFVRQCLVYDPRDRPTAHQLVNHIFVRGMAE